MEDFLAGKRRMSTALACAVCVLVWISSAMAVNVGSVNLGTATDGYGNYLYNYRTINGDTITPNSGTSSTITWSSGWTINAYSGGQVLNSLGGSSSLYGTLNINGGTGNNISMHGAATVSSGSIGGTSLSIRNSNGGSGNLTINGTGTVSLGSGTATIDGTVAVSGNGSYTAGTRFCGRKIGIRPCRL